MLDDHSVPEKYYTKKAVKYRKYEGREPYLAFRRGESLLLNQKLKYEKAKNNLTYTAFNAG